MKKLVSLVLALVILMSCLPMSAFAADVSKTESSSIMALGEIATVTLEAEGNGGYVMGSGSYSIGSTAVVTAGLYPNSEFYGWYLNGELVSAEFVYDFTVLSNTTLVAKFKNISFYNLSVTSTLGGTVTAAEGKYSSGMEIELTAVPDEGYVFAGWVVSAGDIDKKIAETTIFTMPDSAATVTAKFVALDFILGEWTTVSGKKRYVYNDGSYAVGWTYIDWEINGKPGEWFYFDVNGYMKTGWIFDNYYYYINPSNGIMQRGWIKVSGEDYYMESTGVMHRGWLEDDGKKYYFNPSNGIMQRGWITVDGKRYYMDNNGVMQTGWITIDKFSYYFDATTGALQTGWFATNGNKYYLSEDGSRASGWKYIEGSWYYFNPSDGIMQTGWVVVNGEDYYLQENGAMFIGWLVQDGKTYYFNPDNGIMQRGLIKVENKLYVMDSNGVLQTGSFEYNGKKYFANLDGTLVTGWTALNGDWRYFNTVDGAMQTGWVSIDGIWHEFSADGVFLQVADPIGVDFIAKVTTNADLNKALSLGGTNVEIRTDDGDTDQQWRFTLQEDGSYKIVNLSNNLTLEVANGHIGNGSNVQTAEDQGLDSQRWVITRDGDNEGYTLRPVHTLSYATVMDVINADTSDGSNIVLSQSHFGANQQFTITKIEELEDDTFKPKYCLVGNINGNDQGYEGDWESVINTLDANNQITLTFTETSYVCLKDIDNENWYMTLGWQGEVNQAILYNTHTTTLPTGTKFDKLYVPAGTYTFTATERADGTIKLSYSEPLTEINTLYLVPGEAWKADDARFAAYFFNQEGGEEWASMTDSDGDGVYEVSIPAGDWPNVIFCRMDPETDVNDWAYKWNQTNDLTLDGNNNCFTIVHPWSETDTGTWSLYNPGSTSNPSDPSQDATGDSGSSETDPVKKEYCLIGYIDGVDVGNGDDHWEDVVNVFDENGQYTLTVENEAYVCIKDTNCSAWYMTLGWVGDVTSVVLYNTNTTTIPGDMIFDKLHVPAGTYTFTMKENADGTIKLSYEKASDVEVTDVIGDIDKNGKLTVEDVTYIQKTLVGTHQVDEETKLIGDVNGNGKLDIRDATLIQLYLAKKIEHFPVENVG